MPKILDFVLGPLIKLYDGKTISDIILYVVKLGLEYHITTAVMPV